MPDQKPVWEHDCETCKYLGTTRNHGGAHDWYICRGPAALTGGCVIARYGDNGPSYWSHDESMVKDDRYLHVAVQDDKGYTFYLNEKMIVARFMLAREEK